MVFILKQYNCRRPPISLSACPQQHSSFWMKLPLKRTSVTSRNIKDAGAFTKYQIVATVSFFETIFDSSFKPLHRAFNNGRRAVCSSLPIISSVIRQKRKSQNGCFKKTKHTKFSSYPTIRTGTCGYLTLTEIRPFFLITNKLSPNACCQTLKSLEQRKYRHTVFTSCAKIASKKFLSMNWKLPH